MANTFDNTPDPGAASGSFAGTSTVGTALYGVPSALSSIVVQLGTKQVPAHMTPGPEVVNIPASTQPNLISLDAAQKHIYDVDPNTLSQYQKQLWDGGWYGSTTYKNGYSAGMIQSGDDTENAWGNVVMTSAKSGKSIDQVLQDAIDRVNKQGGISATRQVGPKDPTSLVAKVDLYHYANTVARTLIGREMPRDMLDKFIAQYQQADLSGKAGSPDAAAEAFLEQNDPGEVGAQRMVNAFDQLMQMVGKPQTVNTGTPGPAKMS